MVAEGGLNAPSPLLLLLEGGVVLVGQGECEFAVGS